MLSTVSSRGVLLRLMSTPLWLSSRAAAIRVQRFQSGYGIRHRTGCARHFHAQKKGGSSVPGLGLALDSDAQPSGAGKGDEPLLMVYEAGSVPYGDSLAWQRRLQSQVLSGTHPHTLLMLEHDPPVYTLGRRASVDHIVGNVVEGERLSQRGVACADDTMVGTIEAPGMERADIHRIERGGEVTWHGPGQLVGYSIVDLGAAGMKKGPTLVLAPNRGGRHSITCRTAHRGHSASGIHRRLGRSRWSSEDCSCGT